MPPSLLPAGELLDLLRGGADRPQRRPAVLDVRWDVTAGARLDLYARGHIPQAAFVDLDSELAAPPATGAAAGGGGRHPLPAAADFQTAMRAAGVDNARRVIVYDAGPSTAAARAWWLLRYFGHLEVAVLDGGLAAWSAAGGDLEAGAPAAPPPGDFVSCPGGMPVLDAGGAAEMPARGVLLDARAPERFRGELEPIDPVAGHIPGARNRPTTENVDGLGRFWPAEQLRADFAAAGVTGGVEVGVYCGSGVTAAHEVLALELAGFTAALYPGSWSEWITYPEHAVATGD